MNARKIISEIVPLKKGGGGGLPSWERYSPTKKFDLKVKVIFYQ